MSLYLRQHHGAPRHASHAAGIKDPFPGADKVCYCKPSNGKSEYNTKNQQAIREFVQSLPTAPAPAPAPAPAAPPPPPSGSDGGSSEQGVAGVVRTGREAEGKDIRVGGWLNM